MLGLWSEDSLIQGSLGKGSLFVEDQHKLYAALSHPDKFIVSMSYGQKYSCLWYSSL